MARTSLASKPAMLFLLFGERSDPRLLPLVTMTGGRVAPLSLDSAGWRRFDTMYFTDSATMPVYRDGRLLTQATVRRGMWGEGREPLYRLPACRQPKPLAAASVTMSDAPLSLELLATNAPLALRSDSAVGPAPTAADLDSARAVAERAAQREGLTRTDRSELQLTVRALSTGATAKPTLVASYGEPAGGGPGRSRRQLFVIADATPAGYAPSFVFGAKEAAHESRRFIDHLDITGDGVDEIVLEGWHDAGESYLIVMGYSAGHWREIARGAADWCADAPKR